MQIERAWGCMVLPWIRRIEDGLGIVAVAQPLLCACLTAALLASAGGCAVRVESIPGISSPAVLLPLRYTGVIDARAEFRNTLCAINAERGHSFPDYRTCDEIFSFSQREAADQPASRKSSCCYSLVFVPGILGECVAGIATPFSDSYDRLQKLGHSVYVIPVKGRASSAVNAQIIAQYLAQREQQLDRVILIGYSKGVSDILDALGADPDASWTRKIRAVVSVAGVVSGTPAADRTRELYDTVFAGLPWPTCGPGDKGGVDSLTRKERLESLARIRLPRHIKYYSLVAVPSSAGINPALAPFHALLSNDYGPNDGQVLYQDAVIPGSYLLGYLNGDHWAVALPFNRSSSLWAVPLSINNAFPREVLMDAILQFVSDRID
jgi:hypothetical protein